VISAASIIKHPNYNSNTEDNDYALVKLQRSTSVTPVTMDSTGLSKTYGSGKSLWTIGFGNTSTSGSYYPTRLRHVEIKYVTTSTCNNKYGGGITSNMMCAADPGQDSCQGDSGGPLYDADNGVLVGVVSWGYNCADPNYPVS
jgi:Secreted trypsin-like serine protease